MKLFQKLVNKNYWISTGIIILCVMLFTTLVGNMITNYLSIQKGIILDFLSLTIVIFLSRIISEQILEVRI